MLGLNDYEPTIHSTMISTTESIAGFTIQASLGLVEGLFEKSFAQVGIGGFSLQAGGELEVILEHAKASLLRAAEDKGANAIIGFRYQFLSMRYEKSVLAYGTAIKCIRSNA